MKDKQSLANFFGKKVLIIVAVVLLVLVGGFIFLKSKSSGTGPTGSQSTNKGIFNSVKDALTQNLTISCEFTDETGTLVKSYIKNGAVRITSTGDTVAKSGEIIMKDEKMYIWDTATKEGFIYDISSEEGTTEAQKSNSDSYLDMIDKYKDYCKVATVADSFFTPPTDVKFQDIAKLFENLQNQAPPIETPGQ